MDVPTIKLQPKPIKVTSLYSAEQRAERLVNYSRRQYGLNEVKSLGSLREAARAHSQNMAERGFFGHQSPQRGGLARRLQRVGRDGTGVVRRDLVCQLQLQRSHRADGLRRHDC